MERLAKAYGKDVAFLFVYTREAHPDDGPDNRREADATGGWKMKGNKVKINNHTKYAERETAAKDLRKAGKEEWRVLVDAMDDRAWQAWGKLPNSAFLINPKGQIAHKWAWVGSSTSKLKRGGDADTSDAYTLLKAEDDLTAYTLADDPQLPLYSVRGGEWLKYGDVTVNFAPAGEGKVKRTEGEEETVIELKAPELPKTRLKPRTETLTIGEFKLDCFVVASGERETWYCPRLPGDGIARVAVAGKVERELTDAGFIKDESCLNKYDPGK